MSGVVEDDVRGGGTVDDVVASARRWPRERVLATPLATRERVLSLECTWKGQAASVGWSRLEA